METGVQLHDNELDLLDSGFRRNDEKRQFRTFYEAVMFQIFSKENSQFF